jgi:hypothetical protein
MMTSMPTVAAGAPSKGFLPLAQNEAYFASFLTFAFGMMISWQIAHEAWYLQEGDYLNVNDFENRHRIVFPTYVALSILGLSALLKFYKAYQYYQVRTGTGWDYFKDFFRVAGYFSGVGLFLGGYVTYNEYHPDCLLDGVTCYDAEKASLGGSLSFFLWASFNKHFANAVGSDGYDDAQNLPTSPVKMGYSNPPGGIQLTSI